MCTDRISYPWQSDTMESLHCVHDPQCHLVHAPISDEAMLSVVETLSLSPLATYLAHQNRGP